jgi:uncharacterized repeat protein (TIGR02543 family)
VAGNYVVTFNMQTGGVNPSIVVKSNSAIPVSNKPVRESYTAEWYKEPACIHLWNFATDLVTNDITLYAKWTAVACTVSFDANGGYPVPAAQQVVYGGILTIPVEPALEDYSFEGWYKDNTLWDFSTGVTQNMELIAKWSPKVLGVSLNKSAVTIQKNQSVQLIASVYPAYAENQNVSWSSSNTTVATVDNNGWVTGASPGTAMVTVTTEEGNYSATCEVIVTPTTGIEETDAPEIELYPNPSKGFVVIQGAGGKDISIYTSIGHKIYEKNNLDTEEVITISSWAQGIYFISITDKEKTSVVKKLVKE